MRDYRLAAMIDERAQNRRIGWFVRDDYTVSSGVDSELELPWQTSPGWIVRDGLPPLEH